MKKKLLIGLGILFCLLVIRAALPWYDTDDTLEPVMEKYDLTKKPFSVEVCENQVDGAGVKAVPFGTMAITCNAEFFVFLNQFPIQISGEPVPLKK
jgi:hypothetical protein